MRVSSGRALVRWHYNPLRPFFYTYFTTPQPDPNRTGRKFLKLVIAKTETGGASLSENTARFRRKVATLIEWRTLMVLRRTKNEEVIPRLGGRGAELVSSYIPDKVKRLPSHPLPSGSHPAVRATAEPVDPVDIRRRLHRCGRHQCREY